MKSFLEDVLLVNQPTPQVWLALPRIGRVAESVKLIGCQSKSKGTCVGGCLHSVLGPRNSPECLGCTFQGTAAEFPDRDHPGHQVALAHKLKVKDRFATLAREAGLRDAEKLADQLLLLMDGARVAARMFGPHNPAAVLATTAGTLIDSQR